ncbi:IFI27 protein, partial [Zapornia atra]|nr:IFI27 protein [Zapornia atra]
TGLSVTVVPAALTVVGFTQAGIAAGSLAANMMSAAAVSNGGAVASGSVVAIAQSLGAAGISSTTSVLLPSVTALIGKVIG